MTGGFGPIVEEVVKRLTRLGAEIWRLTELAGEHLSRLPRLQLGAIGVAAAGLLLLNALSFLFGGGGSAPACPPSHFPAASHATCPAPGAGTFAIAAFRETATAPEIVRHLEAMGAEVVEGPRSNIWRLRLSPETKTKAEAEALLAKLRANNKLVAYAALAL